MSSNSERFKFWSAAFLILKNGDKILLSKRKDPKHRDGEYGLIAGHIEEGETPQHAIIREAREEGGIELLEKDLQVAHVQLRYEDRTYFDVYLISSVWTGEPHIMEPEKCADMDWFLTEELPENTIDYIRDVLGNINRGIFYSNLGFKDK